MNAAYPAAGPAHSLDKLADRPSDMVLSGVVPLDPGYPADPLITGDWAGEEIVQTMDKTFPNAVFCVGGRGAVLSQFAFHPRFAGYVPQPVSLNSENGNRVLMDPLLGNAMEHPLLSG
ncbi:MAG: hypothetical protein WCO52_00195 [bacterium]